ncbi:hypothetical protein Tco_0757756 [Tanacetum coccineum]
MEGCEFKMLKQSDTNSTRSTSHRGLASSMELSQGRSEEERGDIITSSSSGNEKALASLMVNEYAMINESYKVKRTQNREVFLEIRKRELELKAQELAVQEYEQCLKDEMFYMKSIDHLTVLQHDKMNEMKRTIKAMWNLSY